LTEPEGSSVSACQFSVGFSLKPTLNGQFNLFERPVRLDNLTGNEHVTSATSRASGNVEERDNVRLCFGSLSEVSLRT
jgi:hypothetical protein